MREHDLVEEAYAFLRARTTGDLRFDEHVRPLKYVVEPGGRLVAPVMVAMLQAADCVLFVPEIVEDAMELQITLEQFDEHGEVPPGEPGEAPVSGGALADRWRIHHGDPPDVQWALLHLDAARYRAHVLDGDVLRRPNPLARDEPALCRDMNREHADDLRVMSRAYAGVGLEAPVMVAVDPLGVDVRGRFDVVRIAATEPMPTADAARRVLAAMATAAREVAGDVPPDA